MKKQITLHFSFTETYEGKDEEEIIKQAEEEVTNRLTENVWNYFDDRTIEDGEFYEVD